MIDKISVKDLSVPKMQISFDSDIILPNIGEATANRWGLQIIRSILSRGTLFPEKRKITYIIELRPQVAFFVDFNAQDLIDEIKTALEIYEYEMAPAFEPV